MISKEYKENQLLNYKEFQKFNFSWNLEIPTLTTDTNRSIATTLICGLAYFPEWGGTGRDDSGKYCKTNLRNRTIFLAFFCNQSHLTT